MDDKVKMTARVDGILDKYEGDIADGVLVEKVYIEDSQVVKIEYFEGGELVDTKIPEVKN